MEPIKSETISNLDTEYCSVPVTAHYTVVDGEIISSEFEMAKIPAKQLTDFLIQSFGIDID